MVVRFVFGVLCVGLCTVLLYYFSPTRLISVRTPDEVRVWAMIYNEQTIPPNVVLEKQSSWDELLKDHKIQLGTYSPNLKFVQFRTSPEIFQAWLPTSILVNKETIPGTPATGTKIWISLGFALLLGVWVGKYFRALLSSLVMTGIWISGAIFFFKPLNVQIFLGWYGIICGVFLVSGFIRKSPLVLKKFFVFFVICLMPIYGKAADEENSLDMLLKARSFATELAREISQVKPKGAERKREVDSIEKNLERRLRALNGLEKDYSKFLRDAARLKASIFELNAQKTLQEAQVNKVMFEIFKSDSKKNIDKLSKNASELSDIHQRLSKGEPLLAKLNKHELILRQWLAGFQAQISADRNRLQELRVLNKEERRIESTMVVKEPTGWIKEGEKYRFNAPPGTSVIPFAKGKVIFADELPKLGSVVMLEISPGIIHVYQGLKLGNVVEGEVISSDKPLGYIADAEVSLSFRKGKVDHKGEADEKVQMVVSGRSKPGPNERNSVGLGSEPIRPSSTGGEGNNQQSSGGQEAR